MIDSANITVKKAFQKFKIIVDNLPKKDGSPIYKQLDTSYYDYSAEALNKTALGGKKGARKSKPVTEEEYLEKTGKK